MDMHPPTLRILLVEDNGEDAFVIQHALKASLPDDTYIAHAACMAQAAAILENEPAFSCVFLDLNLPDTLGGADTYHQIRTIAADLPIVITTGAMRRELALDLSGQGPTDFMLKEDFLKCPQLLANSMAFACSRGSAPLLTQHYEVSHAITGL